jgi:hypothetical protein
VGPYSGIQKSPWQWLAEIAVGLALVLTLELVRWLFS